MPRQAPTVRTRPQDLYQGVRAGPSTADYQPIPGVVGASGAPRAASLTHGRRVKRSTTRRRRRRSRGTIATGPGTATGAASRRKESPCPQTHLLSTAPHNGGCAPGPDRLSAARSGDADCVRPAPPASLSAPVSWCCSSATRPPTTFTATTPPAGDGRRDAAGAGGGAGESARHGGRRFAVRLLRGRAGAGATHQRQISEGGWLSRGQARRRSSVCPSDRGADPGRHPGDGPCRADPAKRASHRWIPRAGSWYAPTRWSPTLMPSPRRVPSPWSELVSVRPPSASPRSRSRPSGSCWPATDARVGLAGPGRSEPEPATLREALRRSCRGALRGRQPVRRGGAHRSVPY